MHPLPFTMLYALCLGFCLGVIRVIPQSDGLELPVEVEPQEVEAFMALPPRPEGIRETEGGEGAGYRYTEQGCRELDGQHRDICFHQLARQRGVTDLEGGVLACGQVADSEMVHECLSDVAEQHARADRDASLELCPTITSRKWRDQCVFGVALALTPVDPEYAFDLCNEAGQWLDFCRHDVNGEIAQVDLPSAMAHCHEEEGDLLRRKSCWHGIGKYVGRVDVKQAFAACHDVPLGPQDLYRENCMHGIGWAGAETEGGDFASQCGQAGDQQDSCLLGVAYNLRRFDPVRGMSICATVRRTDLRQKCQEWVGG